MGSATPARATAVQPGARRAVPAAGLLFAVFSAATFGTAGSFASALLTAGWSPAGAVTARVGIAAILLTLPAALALRGRWGSLRESLGLVAGYGVIAVALCQLLFFSAVQRLSVGIALLLEYMGVLLVVVWMWVRHGHRPRSRTVLGSVLAIGGLMLVLDVFGELTVDLVGVVFGLFAGVALAAYYVLSSSVPQDLPPIALAWSGLTVGAVVFGAAGSLGLVTVHASTAEVRLGGVRMSWIVPLVGLAVIAGATSYVAGIEAARRLGAKLASFVGLTEVLFAVLLAWLLLGQLPHLVQLGGGVLVLAGVALVRADESAGGPEEPALTLAA